MLSNILRNCTLFVDGRGQVGEFKSLSLPPIKAMTEGYRPGGLDTEVSIDVGLEPIVFKFKSAKIDPELWKLAVRGPGQSVTCNVYGVLVSEVDGAQKEAMAQITGQLQALDPGDWEAGKIAEADFEFNCDAYRLEIDGVEVFDIDVLNSVRRVGGVDQLERQRAILRIG